MTTGSYTNNQCSCGIEFLDGCHIAGYFKGKNFSQIGLFQLFEEGKFYELSRALCDKYF